MTDAKHTPGPWFVCLDYECKTLIRASDPKTGMRVASTFASHANQVSAETRLARIRVNEANARLIASAPDMLEALISTRASLQAMADEGIVAEGSWPSIDAAIARATGEAS